MKFKASRDSLFLGFLLFLAFNTSFGQKTSQGYIVTNSGDTVRGTFGASRWNIMPSQIAFEGSRGEEILNPLDIKSFSVSGEVYESAIVNVDQSPTATQYLDYSSNPEFKLDTLFLQVIFRSSRSLYYHKNQNSEFFFIKDETNPIEPLIYKKYLVDRKDNTGFLKTYISENRFYVGQLRELLSQCPDLSTDIVKTGYELNQLKKVFNKYAECSGESVGHEDKVKRLHTDFQFIAGLNQPTIKFNSKIPAFRSFTEGDFNCKISPDIGAGVSYKSLRRDHQFVSLFFLYHNLNVTGSHDDSNRSTSFAFSYHWFTSNLNFGFSPVRSIPLYLTLGSSLSFIKETNAKWEETYSNISTPSEKAFESSKNRFGVLSSIGYQIKKISVEFMYTQTRGISNFASLSAPVKGFHFLVRYSIIEKEK